MHRLVFYIIILLPLISHAYIGPGMAGGLIAAIFGIILGYIFLNELITPKVLISVVAVIVGIYFVKKSNSKKITSV